MNRWLLPVMVSVGGLGACSDGVVVADPAAARVNKEEISVSQIGAALQAQRDVTSDPTDIAGRQALERLIDQELAFQRGDELKLDRDPRVRQLLRLAQREIVARAYQERVGAAAGAPTPAQVQAYYDDHPELFADRRLFSIQEFLVEMPADGVAALRSALVELRTVPAFLDHLIANDLRFVGNQAVRAAEQMPPEMLKTLRAMNNGQAIVDAAAGGARIVILIGSRTQPLTLERARPAIEQSLLNEARQSLVEQDRLALRAAATVQYLGPYAAASASSPGTGSTGAGARR